MKAKRPGLFLLSVGDELLDGRTQNTNASFFGEQLRLAGISVAEIRACSDAEADIIRCLRDANSYSTVVVTGGLGPTNDDRTLSAAAKFFRVPLGQTKASLAHIQTRYEARNVPLTPARMRLALVPKGSKILQNPTGTAPGVHVKKAPTDYYFLPGPPHECRPMFAALLPTWKKHATKKLIRREFWRSFGRTESEIFGRIAEAIKPFEENFPLTFTFGVHISFPCIDLTLETWKVKGHKSPSPETIEKLVKEIDRSVEDVCFSRERHQLIDEVALLLKNRGLTVAVAESCTGGWLGKLITDQSGSSAYFQGGVIAYANSAKENLLGVSAQTLQRHGAVSEEVVREMAEGVREKFSADFGVSISGIAGPEGGSEEKPVGTICVGVSSKAGTNTLRQVILFQKGSRDQNRLVALHLALNLLRSMILA